MGIELAIMGTVGSLAMGGLALGKEAQAGEIAQQGANVAAQGALDRGVATNAADQFNATTDLQQAANAQDVAGASAGDFLRKGSDVVESGVAAQGATGTTGEGSPLMVNEDTVRAVALGAARIRAGGDVTAKRLVDDSNLQKFAGANAIQASYLDAKTSLLTGKAASTNADAAMLNTGASMFGQVTKFYNPNLGRS